MSWISSTVKFVWEYSIQWSYGWTWHTVGLSVILRTSLPSEALHLTQYLVCRWYYFSLTKEQISYTDVCWWFLIKTLSSFLEILPIWNVHHGRSKVTTWGSGVTYISYLDRVSRGLCHACDKHVTEHKSLFFHAWSGVNKFSKDLRDVGSSR